MRVQFGSPLRQLLLYWLPLLVRRVLNEAMQWLRQNAHYRFPFRFLWEPKSGQDTFLNTFQSAEMLAR